MRRARLISAWSLSLTLAAVGTECAHTAAYLLVGDGHGAGASGQAGDLHGYLAYAPPALGLSLALAFAMLVRELHATFRGARAQTTRVPFFVFAAVAPLAFAAQEHVERLALGHEPPLSTALEPTFAVGLVLQLPFAAAAYLVARLLLRTARVLAARLARRRELRPVAGIPPTGWEPGASIELRCTALLSGNSVRGPPLPA